MIKIKFNADVVGCGDPQSEFFAEIDDFNKIIDLKLISKNTPWKNWSCTEKEYF